MIQKVVTREEEERQTIEKFLQNEAKIFDHFLISYPTQTTVFDCSYNGTQYQITYADPNQVNQIRKSISKSGYFTGMRGRPSDYFQEIIKPALERKKNMAGNNVTLLLDCSYAYRGPYSLSDIKIMCEDGISKDQNLVGTWQNVFLVFTGGNIQLS